MTTTPSPPSPVALRAVPDRELRFRELFVASFRPLLGHALRRVANPEDAGGIVGETMLMTRGGVTGLGCE